MLNLLKIFCGHDDCREILKTPVNFKEFTFATDGRIAVRVDLLDGFPEYEIAYDLFNEIPFEKLTFVDLPELPELKKSRCDSCRGTGEVKKCPTCNETGEIKCDSDYCKGHACCRCDGQGVIQGKGKECYFCDGVGIIEDNNSSEIIGDKRLNLRFLHKIKKLPNPKVCPDYKDCHAVMPFKFDGGYGILMPMRKE